MKVDVVIVGARCAGAATALLGRVSERSRALLVVLTMTALVAASLYGFNRLQGWDAWAPYFFGAYGLGVLAHWLGRMSQPTWRGLGLAALQTHAEEPTRTLLLFGAVSEFTFWMEFSNRLNFIALDYLIYTSEVIGNIRESYPVGLLLTAIGALAAVAHHDHAPDPEGHRSHAGGRARALPKAWPSRVR